MVDKAGGLKGARYAPTASGGKPLTPPALSTARSAMRFMHACCISELKRRMKNAGITKKNAENASREAGPWARLDAMPLRPV
jgi:hypothetical protein